MSHKTMIDGVAYEISGGKTLVDGTAYSIKSGKTLVDGTAYEVGFTGFETVIDVGAFTGTFSTWTQKYSYNTGSLASLPTNWDSCTHVLFDGVMFEVDVTVDSYGVATYKPKETNSFFESISVASANNSVFIYLYDAEQHTLQLGVYQ